MFTKKILKFSLPMIVANLIMAMGGFVAMWILSMLGNGGVAAGALVYNTFGVMASLVFSFSVPVSIFSARAYGAKKPEKIASILQAGCWVVVGLGIIVALALTQLGHVYSFFHQPPAAAAIAAAYFKGYAFALIPFGLQLTFAQVLNGISKPKTATALSFITLLLAAPLGYLFAKGGLGVPAMGAFGVGLGASIGNLIMVFATIIYLKYSRHFCEMKLFQLKQSNMLGIIKQTLQMGLPISTQRVGEVSAMFVVTILIGHIGQTALASYQVALQFSFVVLMVGFGFTQASGILVGQSIGQGRPKDAIKEGFGTIKIAFLITLVCSAVFVLFPHELVHVFIHGHRPHLREATQLATALLAIVAVSQLFDIVRNVATGALRGYKDTTIPMYVGILACWVTGVPLAYVFSHVGHLGAKGTLIGFGLGLILGAVLMVMRLIYLQRQSLNLDSPSEDEAVPMLDT